MGSSEVAMMFMYNSPDIAQRQLVGSLVEGARK